jgi:hypothetical protein
MTASTACQSEAIRPGRVKTDAGKPLVKRVHAREPGLSLRREPQGRNSDRGQDAARVTATDAVQPVRRQRRLTQATGADNDYDGKAASRQQYARPRRLPAIRAAGVHCTPRM